MDTAKEFTAIEWCAGYGGIHLGLKRAIPNLRVIVYGEIEAFACANLVAKMEAGLLDAAPIWTDIKTFPCEAFRDRVDLLVAGYPCQPFSAAGRRLGTEDPRHLWPHIARAISIIRPRLCFFENVEGHISLGLREVIGELGAIGYTAAWGIFSASEVGAPHQRKRVFILAVSNSLGGAAGLSRSLAWNEGVAGESNHGSGKGGGELAESSRRRECADGRAFAALGGERIQTTNEQGWEGAGQWFDIRCDSGNSSSRTFQAWPSRPGEPQHAWEPPRVVGTRVAHSNELRLEEHGLQHAGVSFGSGRGQDAEAMDNTASLSHSCTQPRSGEERYGKGESNYLETSESRKTQPPLGRDAYEPSIRVDISELSGLSDSELAEIYDWMVKCESRTDELRLLGNGVVPATATRAFLTLIQELCPSTSTFQFA